MTGEKEVARISQRWLEGPARPWALALLERAKPYYRGDVPGSRLTIDGLDGRVDFSYDEAHMERGWRMGLLLASLEKRRRVSLSIVFAAAVLHDLVVSCKIDEERRRHDTERSMQAAEGILREPLFFEALGKMGVRSVLSAVRRCSTSAQNGAPLSIEEACVRDADYLDQLGVIGLLRVMALSSSIGRRLVWSDDPLARAGARRRGDEACIDIILRRTIGPGLDTLYTPQARIIGARRLERLRATLSALEADLADLG